LSPSVAIEALQVIIAQKLTENAAYLGKIFRDRMSQLVKRSSMLTAVRGKGLIKALRINESPDSDTAWNICMKFKENGLLAKPTHGNIIRFAPPLVMTEDQLLECCDIIQSTIVEINN
jgi:ornithine--oxo-acid transaminase